jgi:hypothetical protein
MPLEAAAAEVMPADANGVLFDGPTATRVILCDQLFRTAIGADCGGPAEDALVGDAAIGALKDRFEAAPGRWISVYRPAP